MEKIKIFLKENLVYIVALIVVILVKTYIISPIRVNGSSMNNTLYNRDIMILNRIAYKTSEIERFDIVVVKTPGEFIIKRVIGLPGETVEYKENKLYINGKFIEEEFSHMKTEDFEEKVPDGKYFVLGDNRVNSVDSRVIGPIDKKIIRGKTNLIIYPFDRFGKVS